MKNKKFFSFLFAILTTAYVFAQQANQPKIEAKEELKSAVSEEMASIQIALQLAEYGYKNGSASSLLCAAEILAQVPKQKMEAKATQDESGSKDTQSEKKEITAEQLLADGKRLAGKDKDLLAYAKKIEKLVKTGTRGAFGGPKYDYSFCNGLSTVSYYNVGFVAGRYAQVNVYSMSGADLDLYVYDSNWNLIDRDTSYNTSAWVSFVPRWDGNFHIVVKNNSRYRSWFELYTN